MEVSETAADDIHRRAMTRLAGEKFTLHRELVVGVPSLRLVGPAAPEVRDALGDLLMPLVNLNGLTRAIYGEGLPRPDAAGILDLDITQALLGAYAALLSQEGFGRTLTWPVRFAAEDTLRVPHHQVGLCISLWEPGANVARADLVSGP